MQRDWLRPVHAVFLSPFGGVGGGEIELIENFSPNEGRIVRAPTFVAV